jgi:RNA polymerase sigma factor (sigma-70 family)
MDQMTLDERYRLGEDAAFAEMYKTHRVMLFRYFYYRLYPYLHAKSRNEAEDQAEDVLLEAIQKHTLYKPNRCPLFGWLRLLAKHRCSVYLERFSPVHPEARMEEQPTNSMQKPCGSYELNGTLVIVYEPAPEPAEEPKSNVEQMILNVDILERIPAHAIDPNLTILLDELTSKLKEREQEVLFRTVEGSSDKEIADEMKISVSSVSRTKSEARAKLRAAKDVRRKPFAADFLNQS